MEITENMLCVLDQSAGPMGLIKCIEITHPKWTSVLRFVTNSNFNINVKHEDGQSFEYVPSNLTITKSSESGNLDQGLSVKVGDVGELIPECIDAFIYDEDIVLPTASYREYFIGRYESPVVVSRGLDVEGVTRDDQGSDCEVVAPRLNDNGNGEVYDVSTDPGLAGFY